MFDTTRGLTKRERRGLFLCISLMAALLPGLRSGSFASEPHAPLLRQGQVLFVCEHGNVKSLMAASYFNREAQRLGLAVRAIARGSAPNSTTVPVAIVQGLRRDGFDVSTFAPSRVTSSDITKSQRIIIIGTGLPVALTVPSDRTEEWTDVPAASLDFDAARVSLLRHVSALLDQPGAH